MYVSFLSRGSLSQGEAFPVPNRGKCLPTLVMISVGKKEIRLDVKGRGVFVAKSRIKTTGIFPHRSLI